MKRLPRIAPIDVSSPLAPMQYRSLGRTGLKVSAIGLGCMMFGWRADEAEAAKIVGAALDAGINFFDTSVSYGRGASETILGALLKRLCIRDNVFIATKVGLASEVDPAPNAVGNGRHNVIRQCELSLRRLQVDHIDLLQIHRPSSEVPIEETMGALDLLVRDGKVRYIGTSNFSAWQIVECLWRCEINHLLPSSSEQLRYNILDRRAEQDVFDVAGRYGLGLLVYSPLAEGILTGKYKLNRPLPSDSRFAMAAKKEDYAKRLTPEVLLAVDKIAAAATERCVSPSTLAVAWILKNQNVSSVLSGPSRHEQLAPFCQALDVMLDDECLAAIDTISAHGQSLVPGL
jgi:aryl-alcohol dehydrogenase-like predicted oxidoreductase